MPLVEPCTWIVELYGYPRLLARQKAIVVTIPPDRATLGEVVVALAKACPSLVGSVITPDHRGLVDGYLFNLNGRRFVADLTERLQPGDAILLIANQAGG